MHCRLLLSSIVFHSLTRTASYTTKIFRSWQLIPRACPRIGYGESGTMIWILNFLRVCRKDGLDETQEALRVELRVHG